jgi:predicted methyltransferase
VTVTFFLAAAAAMLAPPADLAAAVESPGRTEVARGLDSSRKPVEVLRFLGLEKGDRALDLFSGGGYYAEIIARAVGPSGLAVAWNSRESDAEGKASWAALRRRTPNAHLVVGPAVALPLAPESWDFALLHLVYHDTYWDSAEEGFPRIDPAAFLRSLHAAMRPGGVVGVVDHVAAPGGDTREVADRLHRIDPATVKADFERAGFVFDGESHALRNPEDDHSTSPLDDAVRGRSDRFVYRFRKPR